MMCLHLQGEATVSLWSKPLAETGWQCLLMDRQFRLLTSSWDDVASLGSKPLAETGWQLVQMVQFRSLS
jgi:hypothetical protein